MGSALPIDSKADGHFVHRTPLCKGHQEPCVRKRVSKSGPNKGLPVPPTTKETTCCLKRWVIAPVQVIPDKLCPCCVLLTHAKAVTFDQPLATYVQTQCPQQIRTACWRVASNCPTESGRLTPLVLMCIILNLALPLIANCKTSVVPVHSGRRFFMCARPPAAGDEGQCKTFKWADNTS